MTTWIDSNYFRTTGISIITGRMPRRGASDEPATPASVATPAAPARALIRGATPITLPRPTRTFSEEVVINRALARRMATDANVVGMRIRPKSSAGNGTATNEPWSTIVAISDDVHLPGSSGDVQDYQVYSLTTRLPLPTFVVRFTNLPLNLESVLRQAIQDVNPTLISRRTRIGDDYLREALAPTRFALALLGAFAGVALVLSIVGLYGSIAYSASQRTREIGIRVALGASPHAVTRLVIGDGVRLTAFGLIVGVAAAIAATRALSSLLYGVSAADPTTFVGIAILVGAVAIAAAYLPAQRASRVDPVNALRAE